MVLLMCGILIDVRDSWLYFKTFYCRAFFRIIPIFFLWIITSIVGVGLAGGMITRLSNSGIHPPLNFGIALYLLFLQSIAPITLFGIAGAWFGHLWSLAVEEQFYLVAPVVVRFTPQRVLRRLLA